ncbi:hypothetical protein LguiB_024553 [Lonicera macranthoides]
MPDHYGLKMNGTVQPAAGGNSLGSSPLVGSHMMKKRFDLADPYLVQQDQKVNYHSLLEKQHVVVGTERAATVNHSLWRPHDHDDSGTTRSNLNVAEPPPASSYFMGGDKINVMGPHYENGLFSSSLSDLFTRKLRLSSNNALYGHSVGAAAAASQYEEEPFESLEEIEAQTIGNLLPNDDDLLSGVTDGLDYIGQPSSGDDAEDLDFFSSVGGMDMGEDGFTPGQRNSEFSGGNSNGGSFAGEHPHGEHPSRTLFVRNINSSVEDSELRTLFEQYGDIRTLYTACKHRGFVMISYYDIRAARNAMKALQNKPLRRRKLDIHFSIPKDNPSEKDINQGTLVVFNLDSCVSNDQLRQIFGVYGEIKEIRETPHRSNHRFIEYYDVRCADAALHALNKSDIGGKRVKLEPSRPGGGRRLLQFPELEQDDSGSYLHQSSPTNSLGAGFSGAVSLGQITSSSMDNGTILGVHTAKVAPITPFLENVFHHEISCSVPSSLSSLSRVESSAGNHQSSVAESPGQLKFELRGTPNFHPHSLPEYHDGLANTNNPCNSPGTMMTNFSARSSERIESVYGPGNGSCPPSAHHYIWNSNSHLNPQPPPQGIGMVWPNSPSFMNGVCTSQQRLHAVPRAPSHMMNTILPTMNHHHHVGSAPSVNPSLWDRRHSYAGESPDASVFHPGSLGNMRISGNSPQHHHHPLEFVSPNNIFPHVGGNCMDLPIASKNVGLHSHHQSCVMFPSSRGQMIPIMTSFDSSSPNERTRSRRNDGSSNQADNKKQFELDVDRIVRGEDKRTTLMIKNIPNKYTSKMLLAAIDERHRGTYDFIYLPIDFKNKCNVGYAFINMTDPSLIVPFYQAFNGKKWEKFNSEKVASLAYARIQGKTALIAHFQNSSLMNEDKRCRPILFHTDGPNAGDQVPFPMGVNVRSRSNKNRGGTSEENHIESSSSFDLGNGEESSFAEDSYTGSSAKDSD